MKQIVEMKATWTESTGPSMFCDSRCLCSTCGCPRSPGDRSTGGGGGHRSWSARHTRCWSWDRGACDNYDEHGEVTCDIGDAGDTGGWAGDTGAAPSSWCICRGSRGTCDPAACSRCHQCRPGPESNGESVNKRIVKSWILNSRSRV